MNIPIYQSELTVAGLAEKIQSQNSVAMLLPIIYEPTEIINKTVAKVIAELSLASENDTDLYITKSILVSTNWNKNDDVFDSKEVWASRYTPVHKPTNIGHDEHKICGHITNVWAINESGEIVPDNTNINDLPSLYHLVNAAVIYKNWEDEDLVKRTDTLIAEIKDNKKFVSMECLFTNFDYATYKDSPNELKIVARAEDTSWMTKHLRCYGGSGEYEGFKIGRVLRNITFCGKGYVDKPANPNSIIFANEKEKLNNNTILKEMVYNSNSLEDIGVNMNPEELKAKNDELEDKIKEVEAQLLDANKQLVNANEAIKSQSDEIAGSKAKIDELVKANTELTEQINIVKATELKTNRISKLVSGGIEKDIAEKKVEIFANLNDEQFNVIADELILAAKAIKDAVQPKVETVETVETEGKCSDKMEDEEDDEEKDSKGEDSVDNTEKQLDKAEETPDVSLTASAETVTDSELDIVRNELAVAIASIISSSSKSKAKQKK